MTGPSVQDSLPDVPWGKVAGIAGGLVATWLTIRGVVGVSRIAYHEVRDRFFDAGWISRR